MAKKKKPEPREWVVEVEMRSRETVIVLADTEEEALANAAGLHRAYVGSIERAERNATLDNIDKLARALSVTPDSLLKPSSE